MNNTVTKRELQIAGLLAYGSIDKEAADQLHISTETVRTHRKNIYQKTGCRNTADLTRWFFKYMFNLNFESMKRTINFLAVLAGILLAIIYLIKPPAINSAATTAAPGTMPNELMAVYLGCITLIAVCIYFIRRLNKKSEI